MEVRFPAGVKKFVFPDVFGTYLTLADPMIAKKIEVLKRKLSGSAIRKKRSWKNKGRGRKPSVSACWNGKNC